MSTSAWWYYGRLRPPGADFNVQNVAAGPGTEIVVMYDGIAISSKPGPNALAKIDDARELLTLVAASYALITAHAFEVSFEGWIEAEKARIEDSIVGFRVQRPPHLLGSVPPARSRKSVDMRRAARLAAAIFNQPGWRLAVRDVHAALIERGDDAFVFGYRALEDLARAVTGKAGQLKRADWLRLQKHLGTTEAAFRKRIQPLRDARHCIAHGDTSNPRLTAARMNRHNVLEISRQIVARAVSRSTLPLDAKHVR